MGESMTGDSTTARVLVVDDERLVVRVIKHALKRHEVEAAGSRQAALALLTEDARFDVILCDLQLGRDSGIELFKQIRQEWPALAPNVVFMHGGASRPQDEAFLQLAPNEQLLKPVGIRALRDLVDRFLAR